MNAAIKPKNIKGNPLIWILMCGGVLYLVLEGPYWTFASLIWINAIVTALALIGAPFSKTAGHTVTRSVPLPIDIGYDILLVWLLMGYGHVGLAVLTVMQAGLQFVLFEYLKPHKQVT